MSRAANTFLDPSGVLADYAWQINHDQETSTEVTIPVQHTASTNGLGLVRQQGDPAPMVLQYSGTILQESQHIAFLTWVEACRTRTIYFRDFTGDEAEVIIRRYNAPRTRVALNPRGGARARTHIWHYEIELEVVQWRSGIYKNAGVHA